MRFLSIFLISLLAGGCVTRAPLQDPLYQLPEHLIKKTFCEMAIMERSLLDGANKPSDGLLNAKDQAEAVLPALHTEWNRRITRIRSGTFAGTEAWSIQKREAVIAYGLHQRELLDLREIK